MNAEHTTNTVNHQEEVREGSVNETSDSGDRLDITDSNHVIDQHNIHVKQSDNPNVMNIDSSESNKSRDVIVQSVLIPDVPLTAKDINFNDMDDIEKIKSSDDNTITSETVSRRRKESVIQRATDALRDAGESLNQHLGGGGDISEDKLSGDEGLCGGHPVLLGAMYTLATMYNLLGQDSLSTLAYTLILICMLAFILIK